VKFLLEEIWQLSRIIQYVHAGVPNYVHAGVPNYIPNFRFESKYKLGPDTH
jgi:hypothetical protein